MGGGRKKLLTVARLWFLDGSKYGRSCRDCRTMVYDEETGRPAPDRTKPGLALPMFRPKGSDPPCHDCPKTIGQESRHFTAAVDPPAWCYRAFRHWRECNAVAWSGPDAADKLVRRNAALFQSVKDSVEQGRTGAILQLFGARRG